MKIVCLTILLIIPAFLCEGQYFQFSQYNYAPLRVNPAQVGNSDYASLSLDYRNQSTDGGFHLTSNLLNATYPLISRYGKRWAGIGISVMDDRTGQAGIFNTQEVAISYSVIVHLARDQTLSLGLKSLYQTSKINLDGFYTGSQYIPDRGFDESLSRGENFGSLSRDLFTFSSGLYWQQTDRYGNRIAYLGLSFFDFNKPVDSFYGKDNHLPSTIVGHLGVRIYEQGNLAFMPEMLLTRSGGLTVLNTGLTTSYKLNQEHNKPTDRIDLISKYVWGRSAVLGIQLHREKFSIGFSCDFPAFQRNVANTGTYEVGLELKSPVQPPGRARRLRVRNPKVAGYQKRNRKDVLPQTIRQATMPKQDSIGAEETVSKKDSIPASTVQTMSERLKQKQDSVAALAIVGQIRHDPLVLEKAILHFNFDFNSSELDSEAKDYLNEVAEALIDNEELVVKLVGHTDNIGSDRFNIRLSFRRAEMVMRYLVDTGVDPRRIVLDGKGLREPLNDNKTEKDRAINRRVELTILYDN